MSRPICSLVMLLCLTLCPGAQPSPFAANATSLVKELAAEDLVQVWDSEAVSLISFYDPANATLPAFAALWEGVATHLQGLFEVSAADGAGPLKWMMETFKVKRLPAVLVLPSRLTTSKPLPMVYKGALEEKAIARWALKQLPFSLISKLTSEYNLKSLKSAGGPPKVVLFHNDTDAAPAFRALSLAFADRLNFAEVKVRTNKTLRVAEREAITTYPTLVVYTDDDKTVVPVPVHEVAAARAFLETHAWTVEKRDEVRKERRERLEKEAEERRGREAKEKGERDARRQTEDAEKKRRRREKRKIVKVKDEAYRLQEAVWQALDGEPVWVRETGWDVIPDALIA